MKSIIILFAVLSLAATMAAAQQAVSPSPHYIVAPAPDYSAWELEMKKAQAEYMAAEHFKRAVIECQEYEFHLAGCDIIQQQQYQNTTAEKKQHEQQEIADKKEAAKIVSDEVKELGHDR